MKNQLMKNIILFKLLIIIGLFAHGFSINIFQLIKFHLSSIKLKIKGIGEKNAFSSRYQKQYWPNKVYINDIQKEKVNYSYFFIQSDNTVELIWNDDIKYFGHMFANCFDITEVDLSNAKYSNYNNATSMFSYCKSLKSINLSNFDTSKITHMNRMFEGCSSLTSIDLSNFDTSNVLWMNHLFYNCSSLTSLNLSNFNTSQATDMEYLFSGCTNLTYLDLSKFDTSHSRQMHGMFANCTSLVSLDLSNFDTSNVVYMYNMFSNCTSLVSLNLTNFNTSNLKNVHSMFSGCSSLTSIDLSNFDTSHVTNMRSMFYNCSSLESLDLFNFDTSSVILMHTMFSNCISLISLNLSNFDTSNVTTIYDMFYGCSNLKSLDISNFDISQVTTIDNIFVGCINLEYINLSNIKENNLNISINIFDKIISNAIVYTNKNSKYSLSQLNIINCYTVTCLDEISSEKIKITIEAGKCTDKPENKGEYKYEYNGKYYDKKINGYLDIESECRCYSENCHYCQKIPSIKDLCDKCKIDYFPLENDSSNIGEYINYYKEPKGYYLDIVDKLYKKCYYTCEICDKEGNNFFHNCIKCNSNYSFEKNKMNYKNCYINCDYYHYFDNESNYHCTNDSVCPKEYPKLKRDKNECIKDSFLVKVRNDIEEGKNETIKRKEEENKYYNSILKNLEDGFTSEDFDTYDIDNGKDEIIDIEKIKITLTTTQNIKNNIDDYLTGINLDNCENLLRAYYNISDDKLLYLKKIDVEQDGLNMPKIEYDIYCKLFGTNLIKLNLTACENTSVYLTIPMELKDNPDIFNSNSEYYNNICYKAKSDDGTDISAEDRAKEMVEGNKAVCQDDCYFYDYNQKKVNCSCKVKKASSNFEDMTITVNYNLRGK